MSAKIIVDKILHWEKWDYWIKYIPLYPVWLLYCLRARSFWFFTASNPTITFGGFEGEGKKEMYDQLPPSTFPKTIYISPSLSFEEAEELMITSGFNYPFAVKPDVGMMGFLFRKIDNAEEFKRYHKIIPVDYILQELITFSEEVSLFYYRFPNQQKGTITGFLKKGMLEVIGDGKSTLRELIMNMPSRPGLKKNEWMQKHQNRLEEIIPNKEVFRISWAANLSRGGKLISLEHEKDEKLLQVFDGLSHYTKHFYYGRYDIKCASIEDLKEGKNFAILEFNGAGAEPHHVYGTGKTLLQAHKIFLHHWDMLYKISKYNHEKNGVPYWKFGDGLKFLKSANKHFKLLKKLDKELPQ